MIVLLTTLAALGAAFFIAMPWVREASLRAPAGAPLRQKRRELEGQRETLLRELKELEFDRRMGKVDDQEYAQIRARATQARHQFASRLLHLYCVQCERGWKSKSNWKWRWPVPVGA